MVDELRLAFRALSSRLEPEERCRVSRGLREALVHATLADLERNPGR